MLHFFDFKFTKSQVWFCIIRFLYACILKYMHFFNPNIFFS